MARTRQLKPEFWTDDDVVTLGMGAKLLFIGMWGLADREGRLEDKPLSILARILPNERDLDPRLLLGELAARNLIERYEEAGDRWIKIRRLEEWCGHDRYSDPAWAAARRAAIARDAHRCMACGSTERLEVHHRKPIRTFGSNPSAAHELSNLTTLCRKCHVRADVEFRRHEAQGET